MVHGSINLKISGTLNFICLGNSSFVSSWVGNLKIKMYLRSIAFKFVLFFFFFDKARLSRS